jgi:sulfite reductase (NADPH) hemoprotein beta-component
VIEALRHAGRRGPLDRPRRPDPQEVTMYLYDPIDREFLTDRSNEFRGQVARRLAGELTEDQFKPLRLMNGLYLQLHAYMLRIAIPYGSLNARQARRLAWIARTYDKGYGHMTTRQNIQFNWIKLKDAPDILDALAEVDLHAIQTSGNCIRNVTADPYAGATPRRSTIRACGPR